VQGRNVAAEYGLNLIGPSAKKHGNSKDVVTPTPSPSVSPAA
jgi:hypothetical protein